MTPELIEAVANRFRVLGAPSRLQVLHTLMDGPLSMGALQEATGLEQSNLSRHVAALEQAGCVRRVREGREVHVEISDPSLEALCALVCGRLHTQLEEAQALFQGGTS